MEKTNIKITRYTYNDYIIDVSENAEKTREAWLHNKYYGIAECVLGLQNTSEADFLTILQNNIDDYITSYRRAYED